MLEVSEVSQLAKSNSAKVNRFQSGVDDGSEKHARQVNLLDDVMFHKIHASKIDPK